MGKDNRTNAWGWISLVLAVTLIGAGFLYQREGGRLFGTLPVSDTNGNAQREIDSPTDLTPPLASEDQDADSQANASPPTDGSAPMGAGQNDSIPVKTKTSRSTPGTLNVEVKFRESRTLRRNGPWLYVNGQLVKDLSQNGRQGRNVAEYNPEVLPVTVSESLSLSPASCLIEAVVLGFDELVPRSAFVLQVAASRAEIKPSETSSVVLECGGFVAGDLPVEDDLPRQGVPDNFETFLVEWQLRVDRNIELFVIDELAAALRNADKSLGNSPPAESVVMVAIPSTYGGRRELNASQVRSIVRWLHRYYWGDWPDVETLRLNASVRPNADALISQIDHLNALIKRHQEGIEQVNSLAHKLDQARTP